MARDHDTDPLSYLEDHLTEGRIFSGREVTPQSAGEDFLRQGPAERARFLAEVDNRLASAQLTISEAQRLHSFRTKLIAANNLARKVNR